MGASSAIAPFPWGDVAIILALIALNGVFAMSELAIVSARKPRLQAMERKGARGAGVALALGNDPGKFLSTIQIGITLIAIGVGAFSSASLAEPVALRLVPLGLSHHFADWLGFALVVTLLTAVSLVVGELVPKQLALRAPEPIAAAVAPLMLALARLMAPIVWLLDQASALIFRLLGLQRETSQHVTAEELHLIFAEASKSGVIEENERAIISGVVRLADRPVREVMTPRTEVAWIDLNADPETVHATLVATPYARLLVADGSIDTVVGVLQSHDVMVELLKGQSFAIERLMRAAPIIPDQVDAMDALAALRRAEVPVALVYDEYGHFEGIVTPADLLAAIAGDYAGDPVSGDDPAMVEAADGQLIVAGWTPADALAERLGITLPEDRDYATVAGFVLAHLKRLPSIGDAFSEQDHHFTVTEVVERRIEQVAVRRD